MDVAIPESIRWHGRLDLPAAATEAETIAELRALAARNKPLTSMIGLGYYGTHTPAGDPPQRAGEPVLVHGVHAVPAGDQPGPARGAAQLPDHGHRPDRAGHRERVDARRGHRRGRGDDAGAAFEQDRKSKVYVVDADTLPQTIERDHDPRGAARHRGRGRRPRRGDELPAELLRPAPAVPGRVRRGSRPRRRDRGRARAPAPWSPSPPTCWR